MEIRNPTVLFIGVSVLILGAFIITFDYPQILYYDGMDAGSYGMLDADERSLHQRILTEFYIGVGIFAAGAALLMMPLLGRIRDGIR